MTNLLEFQFYVYDSVTDQGLCKTLILGMDSHSGATRILSSQNDHNDYIDINFTDSSGNKVAKPDIHDLNSFNSQEYLRAIELLGRYNQYFDATIHANTKPQLRINHITRVLGFYYDWFILNKLPVPQLSDRQPLNFENRTIRIDGEIISLNKRQACLLRVLENSDAPLTSNILMGRVDALMGTITSYIRVSEIFKNKREVFRKCVLYSDKRYSLNSDF